MTVWDFRSKGPVYGYDGWEDLGKVGTRDDKGWTVDGPAAGGFGLFFNDLLDLESLSTFVVKIISNGGNNDERLMFKLHSADGKQAVWYVPLRTLAPGEESEVTFDLKNPDEVLQSEPIDLGVVRQIQVQGTFNPERRVSATFVEFGAK